MLAITGASGAIYGVRLLDVLLDACRDVQLAISPAGQAVLKQELDLSVDLDRFQLDDLLPSGPRAADSSSPVLREVFAARSSSGQVETRRGEVRYYHYRDFMAPMASGSAANDGMVVCPCSGGTLAAIAHGISQNLIHRAADVQLKERRKLVLVPRETPLSLVHLDNMRRATEAGAVVLPAMPGFYHGARSLGDMVDFVVARICGQLGVEHALVKPWGSDRS
ncbi:MAG TPA: flavin prenyltransferase UbiX [Pirellulales bacterium]|nr:flavin prenyltransferase UbiX [Pirellulales bacterium]